ncbi:MAG: TIR domain-containing protein [Actinobacteria bacterium]|nr:TIR domain-containing protein [Actinomycetota bacterium]
MNSAVEFDIFISYATVDTTIVMPFVERLKADGFSVWIDQDQMVGGRPVMDQLGDAIANSAHTIAFLTDAYLLREYTTFELQSSMNRDPASKLARTIPIKLQPLTRDLPNFIQHLTICDLTDPTKSERTYVQIKQSIRQTAPRPKAGVDAQAAALACEAPFQHLGEPEVALFLIRRAADALAQFLYRREIGEPKTGISLEAMQQALLVSGKIPTEVAQSLTYVRTFGNFVVHDQADRAKVTRESIEPALTALRELSAWAFPDRQRDDRMRQVVAALPRIGDPGELQITGTSFRFHEPQTGRTSLGPLFSGRDTASGDAVSVNLVDLPADRESAFLELVGRYADLHAPELFAPIDVGVVDAGDGNRCPFLIFPVVRDVSARELATRHDGRLPIGPAYEIGLGVTRALARLQDAHPPLTPGALAPADVLLSRFGSVRLLCPGRQPESPGTDMRALPALLRGLLTGAEPAGEHALPGDLAEAEDTLRQLADCRSVVQLGRILDHARRQRPAEPSLRSLIQRIAAPGADGTSPGLELIESYPLKSRRAWPLGEGRVLVWETETETLAVFDGPRPLWRDDQAVPIRLAVTGRDGQVAVGGWDGAVRYFAGSELITATRLDGTVGDLTFAPGGLVAGSWKHALTYLTTGREQRSLLEVSNGVHRIAVADSSDRFAVADLSGRLAIYQSDVRVRDWKRFGTITDLAYAGSRLVILTDGGLTGVRLDDRIDRFEPKSGALRLLPGVDRGTCILLVTADPRGPSAALEAWSIDQDDRHIRCATFPAGYRILSTCDIRGRFTVALPGSGCAYWRDDAERRVWPDALAAELAMDGRQIVVSLPDRVELYAAYE